ncbi:hypothetical protein Hokovirus_3_101 [Hokovirus HKV1]|uniref:Uncharacterized protein n=1 Tax=Hokovirus HKV1 TaxID=1977638 RepID=A0A1V0SGR6_9VIRU|nr:hypothetical protein Hokovirus_3_101 [Hokovirus HKV1]
MNIIANNEFLINKNLAGYPSTIKETQCIDYCYHQNSLNRSFRYVNSKNKLNASSCYYINKIEMGDSKKNNKPNDSKHNDSKHNDNKHNKYVNEEFPRYKLRLAECDYKNINYNFTNSPLQPWAEILNTHDFLDFVYKIVNYDSYINFLGDQNIPLLTKLRVTNACYQIQMKLFLISDVIVEFYMQLIKQFWIDDLYDYFYSFIFIEITDKEQNIYIKKSDQERKYYKKEKINYFINKFANRSRIYDYVSKYNEYYSEKIIQMKDEPFYFISQKKYYFDYIKKKIDNIITFSEN